MDEYKTKSCIKLYKSIDECIILEMELGESHYEEKYDIVNLNDIIKDEPFWIIVRIREIDEMLVRRNKKLNNK